MRKISVLHQQLLDKARLTEGLHLDELRKNYTLLFAIKLFKYVKKETKRGNKKIDPIYPKKFNWEKPIHEYTNNLENAGFKLKHGSEPFIDEDTGRVVNIARFYFKPLKKF